LNDFLYCLNTSTIRPVPLVEKIRIASTLGYQAIEPWHVEIDAFLESGTLVELRQRLDDAGLQVVSTIALQGWIQSEGSEYQAACAECLRRMEHAVALGSPSIVASPPRDRADLARAKARFAELVELGKTVGVTPSMEFLGFSASVFTLEQALSIASINGPDQVQVVADVFHLIRGGGSVDDLLTLKGSQLSCFHINDVPSTPDPRTQTDADRVMLGEGMADLPRVIANLRTIEYRGPISLELFNESLWRQDPEVVARTGLERMKRLVETG